MSHLHPEVLNGRGCQKYPLETSDERALCGCRHLVGWTNVLSRILFDKVEEKL